AVLALVLQVGIGVPLGVIAALNRGGWVDNTVRFFGVVGHAIPQFWIGLLLIVLFAVNLHWLPSQGLLTIGKDVWDIPDRLKHILLPAFVLALAGVANYSLIMAGVMFASTMLVISYLLRDLAYARVDPRIKV